MARIKRMLTFNEIKFNDYKKFCKKKGSILGRVVEIAMDKYIENEGKNLNC